MVLSTSIDLLHICFLVVGVLLLIVSPIVNGFYPILLATIALVSSLELALRVNDSSAIKTAAAVSELCVVAATGYGCVAAILHGIHERQVLRGFDDALIETVLWKRNALRSPYSDGKYGNPSPLGNISCSLGYAGLALQSHGISHSGGLTIWFATAAVLCSVVSLLHNLRHERLWAVSSICDSCLFAAAAIASGIHEAGGVMIAFAVVRLSLFGCAIVEEFALMHVITFIFQVASLFVIGAASLSSESDTAATGAILLGCITSVSSIYNGMAELTNSVAQKELLPTGQAWKCTPLSNANLSSTDEESGTLTDNTSRSDLLTRTMRRLELQYASRLEEFANKNNSEDNKVACPGDQKLMGKSDFQSPLFVMTVGTGISSIVMSIGVCASSSGMMLGAAMVILVAHSVSLLISFSRGQTSYGFLCFTDLLEGMVLMNGYYSSDSSTPLVGIILALQLMWLVVSFHVFRMLSIATIAHGGGLLFYVIGEAYQEMPGLRYTSGVFFAIAFVLQMSTLGILLASDKSIFCRWILQSSAAETEGRCEMGFASNREEFDRCVQILRDGGELLVLLFPRCSRHDR